MCTDGSLKDGELYMPIINQASFYNDLNSFQVPTAGRVSLGARVPMVPLASRATLDQLVMLAILVIQHQGFQVSYYHYWLLQALIISAQLLLRRMKQKLYISYEWEDIISIDFSLDIFRKHYE